MSSETRMRVDQLLSRHGYCSRGQSRGWLKNGRITLNGEVLRDPSQKVSLKEVLMKVSIGNMKRKPTSIRFSTL